MHFVRYVSGSTPTWGVDRGGTVHRLAGVPEGPPGLTDLTNDSYLAGIERALDHGALPTVHVDVDDLLAPVPRPGKIVCVGLNYHDHAEEQNKEVPESPLLFGKAPTAVTHPGAPIVHPGGDEQVDYEVELGVVMGRQARNVAAQNVSDYVAGYIAINDVSGRTAQSSDGQFLRGKSYDTFAPMGPALVTEDAVDPNNLDVVLRVNDEVKQSSNTSEFIFAVDELVEYISAHMTLLPGDVISTGTPGGVGIFRDPPDLLEPGDFVAVQIENIGTLENPVVAE